MKRVSSLWSFARWMIENYELPVWNVDEAILYHHMCFLRQEGAAPTRASHLLEALRFLRCNFEISEGGHEDSDINKSAWGFTCVVCYKKEAPTGKAVFSGSGALS